MVIKLFKFLVIFMSCSLMHTLFARFIEGEYQEVFLFSDSPLSNGMTQSYFNKSISHFKAIYEPVLSSEYNAQLSIIGDWESTSIQASASRLIGPKSEVTYIISVSGGLARYPLVTNDGLMAVLCHELGHHLSSPLAEDIFGNALWGAGEGASDYFMTSKCLNRLWQLDDNQNIVNLISLQTPIPPTVTGECSNAYANLNSRAICERSVMAWISIAESALELTNIQRVADGELPLPPVDVTTPDLNQVTETYHNHPQPQCRLDTGFRGALCNVDYLIPFDPNNTAVGACDFGTVGARPACWFHHVSNIIQVNK